MDVLVSVVLCSYNGEQFIREQIDSILNQTYPILELIIQDDASCDKTFEIVNEYRFDPRVKIYQNEKSLGFSQNFFRALFKAKGEYIAFSDQDDIWVSDKIEKMLVNINGAYLIFHNSILFESNVNASQGVRNVVNPVISEGYLLFKPYIAGHECLFTCRILPVIKQLVLVEPNVSYDTLICLVSKVLGNIKYMNENLVYWRRHPSAISLTRNKRSQNKLVGFILTLFSIFNKRKRCIIQRYFALISILPFREYSTQLIVESFKRGTLISIIKTCLLCYKYRKTVFGENVENMSVSAIFFTPLYFIRDASNFIIR